MNSTADSPSAGAEVEKQEHTHKAGGNAKWHSCPAEQAKHRGGGWPGGYAQVRAPTAHAAVRDSTPSPGTQVQPPANADWEAAEGARAPGFLGLQALSVSEGLQSLTAYLTRQGVKSQHKVRCLAQSPVTMTGHLPDRWLLQGV